MQELPAAGSPALHNASLHATSALARDRESIRIRFLDGWRAIAVSLVIAAHAMFSIYDVHVDAAGLPNLGLLGVYIFFLISGFIITRLMVVEKRESGGFSQKNFIIRRCLRILPPLFLYVAVALLATGMTGENIQDAVRAATFTCNIDLSRDCSWHFSHTWTLAFEEQFYLLFPFLVLRRFNIFAVAAATLYVLPLAFPLFWVGRIGHIQITALFALGAAYAIFQEQVHVFLSRLPSVVILSAALFLVWWFYLPVSGIRTVTALAAPIALFVIVFGLPARSHAFQTFLANPVFVQIGLYSYSIYLWQVLFFEPAASFYPPFVATNDALHFVVACSLTLLVSAISYHVYERAFRRLSRRFRYRSAAAAPAVG